MLVSPMRRVNRSWLLPGSPNRKIPACLEEEVAFSREEDRKARQVDDLLVRLTGQSRDNGKFRGHRRRDSDSRDLDARVPYVPCWKPSEPTRGTLDATLPSRTA